MIFFFHQTPHELLDDPFKLYNLDIAVPLHSLSAYLEIGLRRLVQKMRSVNKEVIILAASD